MADKIKKTIRHILNAVSIFIVCVAVVLLVSIVFSTKGSIPNVMGYSILRVLTGSMDPEIRTNSLIIVKQEDVTQLKVGDVISFYSADPQLDGMVNTHRIARIEVQNQETIIYTKGDSNPIEDTYPTDGEHLIGKVIWNSHSLGVLVRLVSNPLIFVPIIVAPLLVILLYHLWQVIHTTKRISKEQEEAYNEALKKIVEKKKKQEEEKKKEENKEEK